MAQPRRFVDLHTHSTASDGSVEPAQLIAQADKAQLAAIALTDHDTTDGLAAAQEAAQRFPLLKLVHGAEVSAAWPAGTLHLLGLGIDAGNPAIVSLMASLMAARRERNPRIIARLRELGVPIEMAELEALKPAGPGKVVLGRLHMAQLLVAKGIARNIYEAFERYLGPTGQAYVDKERLTPREVITAIHSGGGLAVLAHPVQLGCVNDAQLLRVVKEFADNGLDGIEAYHSDHDERMTRLCLDLARQMQLGVTGGSDFHGHGKPDVALGKPRVPLVILGDRFRAKLLG